MQDKIKCEKLMNVTKFRRGLDICEIQLQLWELSHINNSESFLEILKVEDVNSADDIKNEIPPMLNKDVYTIIQF